MFAAIAGQTRHLGLALPGNLQGYQLIKAVKGLIYGGLCIPGLENYFDKGMTLLMGRLDTLLTSDGYVQERAPIIQLQALRDLVDIRNLLRQSGITVPQILNSKIDAMAPALRCVRYGDGGLALFHGGDEAQPVVIDALLQQTNTRSRSKATLSASGFERVTAGRALLMMDCGRPPAPGLDGTAHAGLGSFEFSVGRERLFVNCGSMQRGVPGAGGNAWRQALAASAAHNTMIINDTNAVEVFAEGLGAQPGLFETKRDEVDGNCRVTVTHSAYAESYGIICQRQIQLQADGLMLSGEDQLRGALGLPYTLRFHLHPAVQVSLIQDSKAALLKLPSGQGWRFRATNGTIGGALTLSSSIYAGDGVSHRPTKQLILDGKMMQDLVTVVWSLTREG